MKQGEWGNEQTRLHQNTLPDIYFIFEFRIKF